MRLVKALFGAHIQLCWDAPWCWCVRFVCVVAARPQNSLLWPGMWTDTHMHTHREGKESSQLPLMLHILSSLNNTTHPELSPPSKPLAVAAHVCIYASVYIRGIFTPPRGQWGGEQRPCHKTHRGKLLEPSRRGNERSSPKCWGGLSFRFPSCPGIKQSWYQGEI